MDNNRQTGSPIEYHERCPKCGCVLITNGRAVWCTFVGGRSEPGCDFRATLTMEPETDPAVEALAAYAHEAWAGWMRHLFKASQKSNEDGAVTIPPDKVVRWERQMMSSYAELPESEKESDRKEAREMLAIMSSIYQDNAKSAVGEDEGAHGKVSKDELWEYLSKPQDVCIRDFLDAFAHHVESGIDSRLEERFNAIHTSQRGKDATD